MSLLEVKQLNIDFKTTSGKVNVLRDVSFSLESGESLGIVGESGSGKSVTNLAVMGLLAPNARINTGEIFFQGRDLLKVSRRDLQEIRGAQISMIFQDPMSSLNPCFTVEDQIIEALLIHKRYRSRQEAKNQTLQLLKLVGIPDAENRLKAYPHELSGGMSQRVMIAMAMACQPKLVIADEPTTALDVTIQSQILSLLQKLRKETKMSMILVSHDLGLIAENTDRILVMYAGEVVEVGSTQDVLKAPKHPYTQALLRSLPSLHERVDEHFRLPIIPGMVPDLRARPKGCQFSPRCDRRQSICDEGHIFLKENAKSTRSFRCFHPVE